MKRVRELKENSVTFKKRKLSNFKLILVPVTHDDYSIDVLKEKLRRVQERSDAEFAKLNALEREIKRMRRIISKRNKIAILESHWKYVYVQNRLRFIILRLICDAHYGILFWLWTVPLLPKMMLSMSDPPLSGIDFE